MNIDIGTKRTSMRLTSLVFKQVNCMRMWLIRRHSPLLFWRIDNEYIFLFILGFGAIRELDVEGGWLALGIDHSGWRWLGWRGIEQDSGRIHHCTTSQSCIVCVGRTWAYDTTQNSWHIFEWRHDSSVSFSAFSPIQNPHYIECGLCSHAMRCKMWVSIQSCGETGTSCLYLWTCWLSRVYQFSVLSKATELLPYALSRIWSPRQH